MSLEFDVTSYYILSLGTINFNDNYNIMCLWITHIQKQQTHSEATNTHTKVKIGTKKLYSQMPRYLYK